MPRVSSSAKKDSTANLGFESRHRGIWLAADEARPNLDAATFYFRLSPFHFLDVHHLAPHGMAGFVLVRFWFWLKHSTTGPDHARRQASLLAHSTRRVQREHDLLVISDTNVDRLTFIKHRAFSFIHYLARQGER